jgi:hypothetical protein
MSKDKKYKESEVREKMYDTIQSMYETANDATLDAGKRVNAANTLSNLCSRYKEMFGFEPEVNVGESKMTAVKSF